MLVAILLAPFAILTIFFAVEIVVGLRPARSAAGTGDNASAVIVMLAGPSIAGLLLTGLIDGRAGFRDLFARLRKWRVGLRWYAMAILPAPIIAAGVVFALSLPIPLLTADNKTAIVIT